MNIFEKFVLLLQKEMTRPNIYGWFHILWIIITIGLSIYLIIRKENSHEKSLKRILLIYGLGAFILELLKQISWAFSYDPILNIVTWKYSWYSAPFQLCTTPIYVSLICLFLKKGKVRDSLLSYMAFVTILGSLTTFLYPESCFVKDILVNIHTMYLHCGSLVVSLYILGKKEISINIKNLFNAYLVFLIFAFIAEVLNLVVYHSGILHGETFNMFYISPYFTSVLPVFNILQEKLPFYLFLFIYLLAIFLGSLIVYLITKLIIKKK